MTQGDVAVHHDSRKNPPKNANRGLEHNNVYIQTCDNVHDAFNEIFADDVSEYNQGRRRDRQIHDYYEHIQKSEKGDKAPKTAYEYVFQFGDMFNNNVNDSEYEQVNADTIAMLQEFDRRFNEKFSSCKTISSVIHADEQTPHLHKTIVFVGTGYKKGMKHQCSLTRALNNMGYYNTDDRLALTQWQDDVKKLMVDVMQEYGYEREFKNNTEKHVETDKFKLMKDVEQVQSEYDELQEDMDFTNECLLEKKTRLWDVSKQVDEKNGELQAVNAQLEIARQQTMQAEQEREQARLQAEQIRRQAEREREQAEQEREQAQRERQQAQQAKQAYEQKLANIDGYIMDYAREMVADTNRAFANMPHDTQTQVLNATKSRLRKRGDILPYSETVKTNDDETPEIGGGRRHSRKIGW